MSIGKLLRDPEARARVATWQPLVVSLASLFAVGYMLVAVLPGQDDKATAAQSSASDNRDAITDACLELRRRQIETNRELRAPLDEYATTSARAWEGLETLFSSQPASLDATPQELLERERFFRLLAQVSRSARTLERRIELVIPVNCNA